MTLRRFILPTRTRYGGDGELGELLTPENRGDCLEPGCIPRQRRPAWRQAIPECMDASKVRLISSLICLSACFAAGCAVYDHPNSDPVEFPEEVRNEFINMEKAIGDIRTINWRAEVSGLNRRKVGPFLVAESESTTVVIPDDEFQSPASPITFGVRATGPESVKIGSRKVLVEGGDIVAYVDPNGIVSAQVALDMSRAEFSLIDE